MAWGAIAGAAIGAAGKLIGGSKQAKAAEKGAERAAEIQAEASKEMMKLQQEWLTPEFKSFADPFAYFNPQGGGPIQTTGAPTPGVSPYQGPAAGGVFGNQVQGQLANEQARQASLLSELNDLRLREQKQIMQNQARSFGRWGGRFNVQRDKMFNRELEPIRAAIKAKEGELDKAGGLIKQLTERYKHTLKIPQSEQAWDISGGGGAGAGKGGAGVMGGGIPGPAAGVGLSPAQDLLRRQMFALQQGAFGELAGGLGGMRDDRLELMRELARPQEERAREALFGQQYRTGALESTGGVNRMREFESELGRTDMARQLEAINQAERERNFQLGLFTGGLDFANIQQAMSYRPLEASAKLATATKGGGTLSVAPMQAAATARMGVPQAKAAGSAGLWGNVPWGDIGSAVGGLFSNAGGGGYDYEDFSGGKAFTSDWS